MSKPVAMRFVLEGAGWARLEIDAAGEKTVVDGISYLTDALGDLVRMGIDIATDKGIASAEFDHEGGATVLVAETAWLENNDWRSGARLSVIRNVRVGHPLDFRGRASVRADTIITLNDRDQLARLFLDAAHGLRDQHGEDGYDRLWGGPMPYPRRGLAALESALAVSAIVKEPYG